MIAPSPELTSFLQRYPLDLQLWMSLDAEKRLGSMLEGQLPASASLVSLPVALESRLDGPAVLLMTTEELRRADNYRVLQDGARLALPGRPVLYGDGQDRDLLMEAINSWQISRFVPEGAETSDLVNAILESHRALHLEFALSSALEEYRSQQRRLEFAANRASGVGEQDIQRERDLASARTSMVLNETFVGLQRQIEDLDQLSAGRHPLGNLAESAQECFQGTTALLIDLERWYLDHDVSCETQQHDLVQLMERVTEFIKFDPLAARREVELKVHGEARALVDRRRLSWAVTELLRAALEAVEEGERIEVHVSEDGDHSIVEIWDFNHGPLKEREKVPLFKAWLRPRVPPARLSETIIERQGGTLELTGIPRAGTCYRVRLLKY